MQSEDSYQGTDITGRWLTTIIQVVPSWYDQVCSSYKDDAKLQDLIQGKMIDATQASNFTYTNGVVKYKGRIVIGAAGSLREELVKTTHDSYIGGLPKSEGRDIIMVIVDRFTKYGHFIILAHPFTAQDVVKSFLDHVYKFHGLPATILTDMDKVFTSLFWKELFKHLGVKLLLSTTYHPQMDGQTERVNQCLETYLRCITMHCPKKWHQWISTAQWWYNSSFHSTIGMSPFQALYCYEPPAREMVFTEATQVATVGEWKQRRINMDQLIKGLLEGARNWMG